MLINLIFLGYLIGAISFGSYCLYALAKDTPPDQRDDPSYGNTQAEIMVASVFWPFVVALLIGTLPFRIAIKLGENNKK